MAYGSNNGGNRFYGNQGGGGNRGGGGYSRGGNSGGGGGGKDYPNSGALFQRDKRGPSSPDMGGDFTIDAEVLDYVMKCANAGEQVKLEISTWRKQGRSGDFQSITVNIPYKVRQEAEGGGYRGGGRPNNRFRDDGPRTEPREEQREATQRERGSNPYARQREDKPDYAQGRLDQDEVPDFKGRNEPPFNKPYR